MEERLNFEKISVHESPKQSQVFFYGISVRFGVAPLNLFLNP